jgi:hypothetical protein
MASLGVEQVAALSRMAGATIDAVTYFGASSATDLAYPDLPVSVDIVDLAVALRLANLGWITIEWGPLATHEGLWSRFRHTAPSFVGVQATDASMRVPWRHLIGHPLEAPVLSPVTSVDSGAMVPGCLTIAVGTRTVQLTLADYVSGDLRYAHDTIAVISDALYEATPGA